MPASEKKSSPLWLKLCYSIHEKCSRSTVLNAYEQHQERHCKKKKKIKDMQRLESLLKHFLLPLPIPKCKHDIHSIQWETFIQSIHTKK